MIYSVVPEPLADELYPKLTEHYRDNENVTVIVERRKADRRGRQSASADPSAVQQRIVRDRRRARVPGDLPPLARG